MPQLSPASLGCCSHARLCLACQVLKFPPALAATLYPGCICVWLAAGEPSGCPELLVETEELAALAELCLSSHTHCQETPVLALSAATLALGSAVTRVPELWSCQMGHSPVPAPLHVPVPCTGAFVAPEGGSESCSVPELVSMQRIAVHQS